jgi:hypothetical protein
MICDDLQSKKRKSKTNAVRLSAMISKYSWTQAVGRVALLAAVFGCIAEAAAQQLPEINRSQSFGADRCGPADPAYIKTANETGGVPLFLQRSEAGKAMQLMRESTRENVSTVLWASARLAGAAQKFDVPVDSVTERITFTFSVDTKGTRLLLRQPNGLEVRAGSAGVEDTQLNCGRLITVVKPQAGMWHAEVSGTGTFWLEAQAQSDIYFMKAEFVEVGGRPGHEGLFRIKGQPITGHPATLQVSVSAKQARTTEFALVSSKGDVLQKLHLKVMDNDREFLELTGDVALPNVPFRIAVMGRDLKAMPYQRFDAPLFHVETVQVVPKFGFEEIAAREKKMGEFEVKNFGPARAFKVTVADAHKFVTEVEPKELSLGVNGNRNLKVKLAVPLGTQAGVGDDVVVVVASTSGAPTTNSAIVHLSVARNSNADNQP